MDRFVFIFVDVAESIKFIRERGEIPGTAIIVKRLGDIDSSLRAVDASLRLELTEGDSNFFIGKNLVELFLVCKELQNKWKGQGGVNGPPVRMTMGCGRYTEMTNTQGLVEKRGGEINLTHRLKSVTPMGGLCVTEAVAVELESLGCRDKLKHRVEMVEGYDSPRSFYEADHYWVPPPGERQPIGSTKAAEPALAVELVKMPGVVHSNNGHWKILATVVVTAIVVGVCVAAYWVFK